MVNNQNRQASSNGENVSSVPELEKTVEHLNSFKNLAIREPWLASTAEELNNRYRKLRKEIRENANSWSYSQYCERLTYHYYNLACYYNDELFTKHKIDLESVKKYLEKCFERLTEVSQEDDSNEIKELKDAAEIFLAEVNDIYKQQNNLLTKYSSSNIRKYTKLCIVSGNIKKIPLQQFADEDRKSLEQQIQNIQLIRLINTLEDAITTPEHKGTLLTAERCNHLSQAYYLAGQYVLSMRYTNTAETLVKKILNSKANKYENKAEIIKQIIRAEITEHKSTLAQVKDYIEEEFHKSLSSTDNAFIERKYIKYCSKLWLTEITKELTNNKSRDIFRGVFNSLDVTENLNDVFNLFKQQEYYKLLIEHFKLITKANEKSLISQYKKVCLEHTVAYIDSAKKELLFLEAFVAFLSSSHNLQSIIAELDLEDFCCGKLLFDEFLKGIINLDVSTYGASLATLQETAKCLQQEEDLFLIDKLKEVIGAYINPVEIQERKRDGRLVVEVAGKNIVINEILCRLEKKLSENPSVEEVRFVGASITHIDKDFKNEVWHGKNVIVLTNTMKIHDKVTWNVSGKDNEHTYSSNAGTGEDGCGKQGADGYAGESGGNVLILAEKVENPENFTIISNGGKGSKGQDGGNGKVGNDGIGITKAEFDQKFPPIADFSSGSIWREHTLKLILENIKNDLLTEETVWYTGANNATIEKIIEDIENISPNNIISCQLANASNTLPSSKYFEENIFIKATTTHRNEITFSFEHGGGFTSRQAFFLYKGSLGQPGKHGGEYGLGGEGGYAGEILVINQKNRSQEFNVKKSTKQGEVGENGQGGLYGNHGKNGWDMGYLDHKWWSKAKFRNQGKYKVEYFNQDNNPSDLVWCPYKKKYAGIIAVNVEHKSQKKYEERKNTRQNTDRQHHAQAARKKNIVQNSIFTCYSHHLSCIENETLQNLQSDLKNTEQHVLQAITENQEQKEKQSTESKIKRNVNFTYQSKIKSRNATTTATFCSIYRKPIGTNAESLIKELKDSLVPLGNWFELKDTILNLSQLNQLFLIFEHLKDTSTKIKCSQNKIENSKLQDIENLLIDKYRIAILQAITKLLPPYKNVVDNPKLTPESAVKYLVEAKENDYNISHPVLGTLHQYLNERSKEQYNKISKFCDELQNNTENCEILKHPLKAFILEVGISKETHFSIKKYYEEYKGFLEKHKHSLNIFFESFKSELSRPRHAEVFALWIESIKDKSLRRKLEEQIQRDNFLNALYNRFNNHQKQEYNWDNFIKDQDILKEYYNYIQSKGPLSESYRELLAYVFDINIRLYVEDEYNNISLQDNHNSSSKQVIHLLHKDNEFIKLNIDENYLRLETERKKKDELYGKIFSEIGLFKQKQEFYDYLEKQTFLFDIEDKKLMKPFYNENSFHEEEDIKKIIEYFPEGEKQRLKERLEKITSQYIGQRGILHNMMKRFSSEGKHVSFYELCCLTNSIISSSTEERNEQNTFSWIVAAYPQENWIDELILLQLENYFKKQLAEKSKWRQYLSKIENKNILLLFHVKLDQYKAGSSISIECVEDILYLLSNINKEKVNLDGLGLPEWPYALKEKYWSYKLSNLTNWQESEKLSTASYYLLSVENTFGTVLVKEFLKILETKKQELSPAVLTDFLYNFYSEKWNLSERELKALDSCKVNKWAKKMQEKFTADMEKRGVSQLLELIKNNSEGISNILPKIENSIRSISNGKYVIAEKCVNSFTESDIKNWVEQFQNEIDKRKQDSQQTRKEMLAIIDRAIELKKGFILRNTQKLTVLALLTNNHSTLAQVSTGEGKSLIVVAVSIMKALFGENVDIITSSSVLAKRDAKDNRDIYSLFNIDVSHNCSEDIEKRKEAYSGNQVVYGDLSYFQRDYLLHDFYSKKILGDHKFDNVIIDEVDSMLLDKGNNMLYLSHDLAGLDKLESVYIYVWQWINRPARNIEELSYAFNTKEIKEAILNDLYGLVRKEDIGKLDSELNDQQKNIIWERLIKAEVLDKDGKLLVENINDNKLNQVYSFDFISYKDRLNYLLKECIERERYIHVPNYLRPFVEMHLECWINSAVIAFCMKAGQDYVVDVDRSGSSPDRNPNITILDRNTGTDQANSQWDEALHQFLQLKHGCKLSLQSLKAVFVSNVSFFKLYHNLYGLTGTIGSQRERELLQKIHKVDFVIIPTAKSKQFVEEKPILCTSNEEWISHIYNEVKKMTEKRSVLIICETVNDVEILHKTFFAKDAKYIHTYTRDYEEFDITQGTKELEQGQIIIATNLAGRGTDIKITKELRQAGGLHICLTYMPSNIRIEQQAFGRAARSGDKGSGQLIIIEPKGQEYSNSKILDLKKERDAEELHRISDIKAYYDNQITVEENCFKAFKNQYEKLKKYLEDREVPTNVQEILLRSCLDKWAFWLDENSKYIKNLTDKQSIKNFDNLLNKFISQLKNLKLKYSEKWSDDEPSIVIIEHDSKSWFSWVDRHPTQMIKLGKYLSQNNDHDNAIELFDEVMKQEPYFSEAAHYYKAFALAKKIDWEHEKVFKTFKKELRKAAELLDEHSKFSMYAEGIIGKIKTSSNESIIQVDAYEEQQKNISYLYSIFSQSIDDILGHFVTPYSFINNHIEEEIAEIIFEDLLREGILNKPRVKKNICEEKLKVISSSYGIPVKTLDSFLSGYKGKELNEKEFRKALKEAVQLPSRETFWKLLVEQKVLSDEVKYVVIDSKKLRKVDPSLLDYLANKINEGKLEKQTLESGNEEVFLNVERIAQQKTDDKFTFKKHDFKGIDEYKYQILKNKKVLSFNRKARIDQSKIASTTFPDYDFITAEDFTQVNIAPSEGEQILAELVEQKVLEKDPENRTYKLKVKFDEIGQVQLPSRQVYEDAVKGLLHIRFTYRIALQRIVRQLEEKNILVGLQLITKPHHSIFSKLLEQRVVKPIMVKIKDENLETKLISLYSQTMTKNNFKLMLSQNELIPKRCTEELFNLLVVKRWIIKYDPKQYIKDKSIDAVSKENITNSAKSLVQDLYSINDSKKGKMPLNSSFDNTLNTILNNRLQLSNKDTIKMITRTLEQSRSTLKTLKVPKSELKLLTAFCGQGEFTNIEEMHIFFLNGLDQLLQLEEKKWTQKMLRNTLTVVAMGMVQIVIGTGIELLSVGVMTHVGAAFISEGVNDIIFAAGALKSGYFNWNDYWQHKFESLIYTAFTAGIGAYCSRGAKVSRFGYKLVGPNFEVGEKVAQMAYPQLMKTVGWKILTKEVVKRITLKTIEGVAFGLANVGVDILVENCLQKLCDGIASSILSNIERQVEVHNISASLVEVYKTLGEKETRTLINNLNRIVFTEKNCIETFLPVLSKIASSVTKGITEAIKKRSKTSNKLELPMNVISKVVLWSERISHIANIVTITNSFMDNLNQKLNEFHKSKQIFTEDLLDQNKKTEKNYNAFKHEVINEWKLLLCKKVEQVIAQHIVSPILKDYTNRLVGYVGKTIQEEYQSCKESEYYKQFEELKQQHQEELSNARNQQRNNTSQIENHITKQYHEDLQKILIKTRNPKLFAAIVRESIPMDFTCVNACTQIVHRVLIEAGIVIPGLNVSVEGDGGIRQTFSSAPEGVEGIPVRLKLQGNHFQLNNFTSESNGNDTLDNNCLFEVLSEVIPQLRTMTARDFRDRVANCIESCPEIQYHIQQGWHQFPLSHGVFGGARNHNVINTTNILNKQAEYHSPYQHSSTRGKWDFDGKKDVDLREVRPLSNEELNTQRAHAFNEALNKINQNLYSIQKKRTPVVPENFEVTKYDAILCTGKFGKIDVALYPVEMETTVEVWHKDILENVNYTLRIDFDNPIIHQELQGPRGPHIGYDVIPHNQRVSTGVTGHILINQVENKRLPDRGRSQYSIDDNYIPQIPVQRVFFPPNRFNTYLERIDAKEIIQTGNKVEITTELKTEIRGRSYPSPYF